MRTLGCKTQNAEKMKQILTMLAGVAVAVIVFTDASAQSEDTSIKIQITKEVDGETKTLEKTYSSEEEMRNDPDFQEFTGGNNFFFNFNGPEGDFEIRKLKEGEDPYFFKFNEEDGPHAFQFGFDEGEIELLAEEFGKKSAKYREEMEKHLQELEEKLSELDREDLEEDLAELKAMLEERVSKKEYRFSIKKRLSVERVEGDEFGKKGVVEDSRKLELEGLNFFPNPNDGRFRLRFRLEEEGPLSINVYDMEGKDIYKRNFSRFGGIYSETIDLRGNEEGLYLLEIASGKNRLTRKIVIKE